MPTYSSIRCLHSPTPDLKADEKLFLILLLVTTEEPNNSSRFSQIESNGEQLGTRFRFTKTASFRALKKLEQMGMVTTLTDQGRIGRPKKIREIVPGSWETGKTNQNAFKAALSSQCSRLINNRLRDLHLFEQVGSSNALFLLLLVLVGRADQSGVISTASHATLSHYTGIPLQQIHRRINRLKELNIIAEVIPGLVDGSFLGKPRSIYYLNFQHPIFKNTGISVEPIEIKGKGCTSIEINQIAIRLGFPGRNDRLASAQEHFSTPAGLKRTAISPGSWEENAPAIINRPAAKLYTQCVIERYAAKLLSDPNSILSSIQWRNDQDRASGDFMFHLLGGPTRSMKKSKEHLHMFHSLCADLEELSHQLASVCLRMGKLPKRRSALGTYNTVYRILPSGIEQRSEIRLERITFGANKKYELPELTR